MTTLKELLERAFDATEKEMTDFAYTHFKKLELETLGIDGHNLIQGIKFENQRIAPLAKEIIVELVEVLNKSKELLLEPHNTGNAFDARNLMEETLAKVEARLRGKE